MDIELDRPLLGVTIGDVNGVSPEVILKCFNDKKFKKYARIVIYGTPTVFEELKKRFEIENFDIVVIKSLEESQNRSVRIMDCGNLGFNWNPGRIEQAAGTFAIKCLDKCLDDLLAGKIDGMITGPLNKSTVKLEGKEFRGHTDYIKNRVDSGESLMILCSDRLRVALVTGHVAIRDIPKLIDTKTILSKIEILNKSLQSDFGIGRPRIAVLGLNPHAGDNNLIGKEEFDIILPAINAAKDKGILTFGPYPADGFFGSGNFSKFDGILAMYHDQGLVPFKALSFGSGVNFTAGLPIVRTSPDHGTAYDIAGKFEADAASMEAAVFAAIDIIRNRTQFREAHANPLIRIEKSSEAN